MLQQLLLNGTYTILPIILYIIGFVLIIIELFLPSMGLIGILGIISFAAGIVLRIIGLASALEIVLTIVVFIVLLALAIGTAIKSAKSGRISRSALILYQSNNNKEKATDVTDFSVLLGKVGTTTTFLRPIGKAKFGTATVEVINNDNQIVEVGEEVKVIAIEGQKIIVEKQ